ncbi:MAG: zinc ribbon domain-containing protein [Lachnospiraceae bacterium]|nr:zinc ribbon domain-containing protein [Lachnospiraceae bacterium]
MKACIKCGNQIPDEAGFCPYCETVQNAKKYIKVPKRRRWLPSIITILFLAAAVTAAYGYAARPKTYEGSGGVTYKAGGQTWKVFAVFNGSSILSVTPEDTFSIMAAPGSGAGMPGQLCAVKEGSESTKESIALDAEEFLSSIDSAALTADNPSVLASGEMDLGKPAHIPETFPLSLYMSNIYYSSSIGKQGITWTLHMKNKDTIILHQTLDITQQELVQISPEDAPMNTSEELNDLLSSLADKYPTQVVELHLPPATYEGDILISSRGCILIGSRDGDAATTFTGTLGVTTRLVNLVEIHGILFDGTASDAKKGILANEGVLLYNCTLKGWDTAVSAENGSWGSLTGCTLEDNRIGFHFNSTVATCSNPVYQDNVFRRNETAVLLSNVPGSQGVLMFPGCVFEGNGTDIENTSTYTVE